MMSSKSVAVAIVVALAAVGALLPLTVEATTLRIVSYNIEADIGNGLGAGLETVLEGIGKAKLSDNGTLHAQPLDILALQEVDSSTESSQLQTIVNSLNATYGAGTYAYCAVPDPTTGGTGGGPTL